MAKIAGKVVNLTIGGVVLEDDGTGISLDITQELPDVTSFSDAGPRVVTGNYGWGLSFDGAEDFAAGQSDATIFAGIGLAAGQALDFDPTGVAVGASAPHYTGQVFLASYSIKTAVGAAATFSAGYNGGSALTRAVA